MRHLPRTLWHVAFGDRTSTLPDGRTLTYTRRELLGLAFWPAALFPRAWYRWMTFVTEPEPVCAFQCRRFRFGRRKGQGWSWDGECRSTTHGLGKLIAEQGMEWPSSARP